jgi:hypothetical protein
MNNTKAPPTINEEGGVYNPELLLANWTNVSFILMTVSLLFYHMTCRRTLEMDRRLAGVFAISIIIMSVVFSIQSLIIYSKRLGRLKNKKETDFIQQEISISHTYIIVSSILIVIAVGIAIVILLGSFYGKKSI